MYLLEFIILQILVIIWLVYVIKNYPKKNDSNSYNVLFGSIGAIILMTFTLIWFVANQKSILTELWTSIIK